MPMNENDCCVFTIVFPYDKSRSLSSIISEMAEQAEKIIEQERLINCYPEMTVKEQGNELCLTVYQYLGTQEDKS
jgi:hypothetical protein